MIDHPTGNKPERIVIVACGPSKIDFVDILTAFEVENPDFDEVWGVNRAGSVLKCDLSFFMDDVRQYAGHNDQLIDCLKNLDHKYFTSSPLTDNALQYPLGEVLSLPRARTYLNHTVGYALAYAALVDSLKEVLVFGADYIRADVPYAEKYIRNEPARYMACAAYWCGYLEGKGIRCVITPNSPLLDANIPVEEQFYGYLIKPVIRRG